MHNVRILAFFASVMITVFLMRVIADGFPSEPPPHAALALTNSHRANTGIRPLDRLRAESRQRKWTTW
jgi:hypothetical protein